MKQLTNTIQQLKLNANKAMTVVDNTTGTTIVRNFTGKMLSETYGSVEAFFEDLKTKGVEDVNITNKTNNFPGWKKEGESYNMRMQGSATTAVAVPAAPIQNNVPMAQNHNVGSGLNGLNAAQETAIYRVNRYEEILSDNNLLRQELATKNAVIEAQKETINENKFDDKKATRNNDLLGQIIPLLTPFAEKLMNGNAAVGLGTPQLAAATSPIKQAFFAMIANTDDDFVQDLMLTAKGMSMEDPAFDNELTALVSKYQITL